MNMRRHPPPEIAPPGELRYLILYGSHAHGTATATSDEDWRGVYQLPNDAFLGLIRPRETFEHKPTDSVYWELGHFCRLLLGGNPNLVGMLWAPPDVVYATSPVVELLRLHRQSLITRRMAMAYLGWVQTELRVADLPPKRLSHVPRLLYEISGAIADGEIPVRLTGDRLEFVIGVKLGQIEREAVDALAAGLLPILRAAAADLPDAPTALIEGILLNARHGNL